MAQWEGFEVPQAALRGTDAKLARRLRGNRSPWHRGFESLGTHGESARGESGETLPVADKVSRFRGSGMLCF